ncbi:protein-export chaperone SecB [Acidithiobacillus sp.]|uniref:protein-export chaperone SecB n=1 Tax=Acidithiobacillus sp. TaxID=1872118 RepID=UPI002633B7D6|nr:protein-export chaperone SecB [Acidithiobacillus sp.]MDD5280611.1 protein-export chaperone SecB [Acidithiobacillus sp.]
MTSIDISHPFIISNNTELAGRYKTDNVPTPSINFTLLSDIKSINENMTFLVRLEMLCKLHHKARLVAKQFLVSGSYIIVKDIDHIKSKNIDDAMYTVVPQMLFDYSRLKMAKIWETMDYPPFTSSDFDVTKIISEKTKNRPSKPMPLSFN